MKFNLSEDKRSHKLVSTIRGMLESDYLYKTLVIGGRSCRDLLIGNELTELHLYCNEYGRSKNVANILANGKTVVSVGKPSLLSYVCYVDGFPDIKVVCSPTKSTFYSNATCKYEECFGSNMVDALRHGITIDSAYITLDKMSVIDPCGLSVKDVSEKTICLNDVSSESIIKNPSVMMKAISASCNTGFGIESGTWFAIIENSRNIALEEASNIKRYLNDILLCDKPSVGIEKMRYCGLLDFVLPEIASLIGVKSDKVFDGDVYTHTLLALDASPKDLVVRYAVLFHDCAKLPHLATTVNGSVAYFSHDIVSAKKAGSALRYLGFDTEFIDNVNVCILNSHYFKGFENSMPTKRAVKNFVKTVGEGNVENILLTIKANQEAHTEPCKYDKIYYNVESILAKIATEDEQEELMKTMPVNGDDIMNEFNLKKGPEVGRLLGIAKRLYEQDDTLTKEEILEMVAVY